MPKIAITEASTVGATLAPAATKGRLKVTLITAGVGSSGYYSPKVLENAAKDKVFPAGTHCFIDHPGNAETYDRPERSIRDLAAVLTEDAVWDADMQGLVAEAQAFGPYHSVLSEMADSIGVSIRAYADSTVGEFEGKKMPIITQLVEGISADFVTRAGRGGFFEVLESARPEQVVERAIRSGVTEATANDTRDALGTALKDAYGGEKSWVWVRDFDEATVWFTHESPDGMATYQDSYELDADGAVTLSGSPVEVRAKTVYVPVKPATESGAPSVPAPAGQPNTPNRPEEDTMGHIQVDEAEHGRLTEAAGRVPTLESERDTAVRERDTARSELALFKAREASRPAVTKKVAESGLPARRQARIIESVLQQVRLDENGTANADELVGITDAAIGEEQADLAELAESLGVGSVRGFGQTVTESSGASVEDFDKAFNTSQEG